MPKITICELVADSEFAALWPLIKELNPAITKAVFTKRLKTMRAEGYRCIVAVEKHTYIGACGFWVGTRFWCGQFLDIDNFIVTPSHRGKGIGEALIAWTQAEARRLGCDICGMDSYVTNHNANRFYHKLGYAALGYHFVKYMD